MQQLQPKDRAYVEHRRAQKAFGLFVLPALLLALVFAWGGLYVWSPTFVNPLSASERYKEGNSEAASEAAVKAFMANATFLFAALFLARGIGAAHMERRYRRLVDELTEVPGVALESVERKAV